MCGIAGFLGFRYKGEAENAAALMADALQHRGPDDSGLWVDAAAEIALSHRRLSVLELTQAGHQPMLSGSGRYVLTYNGEIYNHLELRKLLSNGPSAAAWRGHSDTETLLAGIEALGLEETLKHCVGMFAFALWDRKERCLTLARDRAGEKPLYYGWQNGVFLFGSELKALRAHPAFNASIDRGALALLLRHNYVPAPYSIYQGIFKLPPGTWLQVRIGQCNIQPQSYWSLNDVAQRGTDQPFEGTDADAIDELERLLGKAVAGQQVADVPLGALLSGGIDSSLITALMQSRANRPVHTFTIGFEEKDYNEAAHARAIAEYLGTDHTELRLSADEALALVPKLPAVYDEPFADSSQIPTYLVMKLARQHVTVALSGDAGDEFFAGYNRYAFLPKVWRGLGYMPAAVRTSGLALAGMAPRVLERLVGVGQMRDKLDKLKRLFQHRPGCLDDLYLAAVSEWPDAAGLVVNGDIPPNFLDERKCWPRLDDSVARMMALDTLTYLPDDVLAKVDRAAMAVSLETRAPFLDRDVMEFAWRLPMSMKLREGKGKWILRKLLDRHVPPALVDRPKMGFGVPLDQWLRGPLREWAGDLLEGNRLRKGGYLCPDAIEHTWKAHLHGEGSFGYRLWSVLMFQAWLEAQ